MTDKQKRRIEKLGMNPSAFEPSAETTEERLTAIEDALIELAEIITEEE